MRIRKRRPSATRVGLALSVLLSVGCLLPQVVAAQGLTGSLIGKVRDEQGAPIHGAAVRLSSPALIGGPATLVTNEKGQLRFPVLPTGLYALEIEMPGFATLHDQDILIAAGATIERTATLKLGVDFIQEVQVSAIGASAEFGNMQGAIINVVTKQGGERFTYNGTSFGQASALTSQPVRLRYLGPVEQQSGYERAKYEDFTNNLGGPARHGGHCG